MDIKHKAFNFYVTRIESVNWNYVLQPAARPDPVFLFQLSKDLKQLSDYLEAIARTAGVRGRSAPCKRF